MSKEVPRVWIFRTSLFSLANGFLYLHLKLEDFLLQI